LLAYSGTFSCTLYVWSPALSTDRIAGLTSRASHAVVPGVGRPRSSSQASAPDVPAASAASATSAKVFAIPPGAAAAKPAGRFRRLGV
jgi:hypothetical protein